MDSFIPSTPRSAPPCLLSFQLTKSVLVTPVTATDLHISNLPVEQLVENDEAIRRTRRLPLNEHRVGFVWNHLVRHRAWDVVCLLCRVTHVKKHVYHMQGLKLDKILCLDMHTLFSIKFFMDVKWLYA